MSVLNQYRDEANAANDVYCDAVDKRIKNPNPTPEDFAEEEAARLAFRAAQDRFEDELRKRQASGLKY